MTSERGETSPPGPRFVRFAAVFLLGVAVLRNGWSLLVMIGLAIATIAMVVHVRGD